MKILIQYPSRERPANFEAGLKSISKYCTEPMDLLVHAVFDWDDPNLAAYIKIVKEADIPVIVDLGDSTSKIDAINRPLSTVHYYPWDILLTFSDDMRFTLHGWDRWIVDQFADGDTDKFIHFYEKDSGDRVSVMDVVGRDYYNRDGWIYNPEYLSLFCDEEKTEIARLRGKYKFVNQTIFEHVNPRTSGKGLEDKLLREQQAIGWTIDQATFLKRKSINFGL